MTTSTVGLVNMRAGKKASEIDFTALVGNEYGVFSAREIKEVPVPQAEI